MPYAGVIDYIEALGLRTFGKEVEDPTVIVKRPKFNNEYVRRLYKIELLALWGLLLRDEGTTLDRDDPDLFDEELDDVLEEYGPRIWPKSASANRSHLRTPHPGSLYPKELVYPRDKKVLKQHLRSIILCKKDNSPNRDVDALINKKGEKRAWRITKSAPVTPKRGLDRKGSIGRVAQSAFAVLHRLPSSSDDLDLSSPPDTDTDDSVVGNRTRTKSLKKGINSKVHMHYPTQLRLYKTSPTSGGYVSLPAIVLTGNETSDECFTRICQQTESDCSWIMFQFPEDMSPIPRIRVDRGSRGSEALFQSVLDIFRAAPRFPGDLTRVVEVECGLDMLFDME
ncbi:uncharacterized protein BDR25DRAFT_341326 [Lindgomyces ingoldianus]|uniref:Uncharacterized protein n=1 Tax=Lindgomyces ingoldianus TaxID=673940 RepID=A0ACB6R1W7_9PLEO|nr:uncharacterized protein BDR25DRAFT_341326 [Lindgomyces ingoldianus]KAF2473176.1 hypothetical protein BDR25DRAFT_341326 [Lindgomyces ingoldianus]